MFNELRDHDWEMLSAYLDGQVSSSERAAVEMKLLSNAKLNDAFRSLQRTRLIIKETSLVKRRRNFYLSPEMVKPIPWVRLISVLNYSSLAVGLLAIMLFFMDIVPAPGVVSKPANISTAPATMDGLTAMDDSPSEAQVQEAEKLLITPERSADERPGSQPEVGMPEILATSTQSVEVSGNTIQEPVEISPSAEEGLPLILAVPPEVESLSEMPAPMMKSAPEAMEDQSAVPGSMEAFSAPAPMQESRQAEVPIQDSPQEIVTPETLPTTIERGADSNLETPSASITSAPSIDGSTKQTQVATLSQEIASQDFAGDIAPQEELPIRLTENWMRIGWIFLLLASGTLAFVSLVLRKREQK
jgi:hypothetical protein